MKLKPALAVAVMVAAGGVVTAAAASGAPPGGTVPPHQHYVISATGELVPVGPDACNDGPSHQFDNFHLNVHRGQPFANGIISFSGCP